VLEAADNLRKRQKLAPPEEQATSAASASSAPAATPDPTYPEKKRVIVVINLCPKWVLSSPKYRSLLRKPFLYPKSC
jgi:hypothetical protein